MLKIQNELDIEKKFTERELGILEKAFSENKPMKEITISNLLSIKSNVNEHIYEAGWINGQGNESEEYIEEIEMVREKLNTLTEDEGEQLYKLLMEREEKEYREEMTRKLEYIIDYSAIEKEEIMNYHFDEVKNVCINIDKDKDNEAIKDIDGSPYNTFRKQEFNEARFSLIADELEEYQKDGWNIDYAVDTINTYIASEGIDIYCLIGRNENGQVLEVSR